MYFRIEKSTPTDFTASSNYGYTMELDRYRPGFIIFTTGQALMTSGGTTTYIIAGYCPQYGYREGVGAEARFGAITGFTQISEKHAVVAEPSNRS